MLDLLRGEVRKLTTTRTPVAMLIGAVAVVVLVTFSMIMSVEPGTLTGPMHDQMFYLLASTSLGVFAVTFGIRAFTDEFRHGTLASTVLTHPSRRRVLIAKSLVAVLTTTVMTVASLAAMVGLAAALASVKDGELSMTAGDMAAFAGLVAGMAAWAVIGTALGAIIRHQVSAIVGGLVWVLVVENIANGFLREAARFTPGQAVHALADVTRASHLSSLPFAAATLLVYLAMGMTLAGVALQRRDVI